jgi:hypothetical protein
LSRLSAVQEGLFRRAYSAFAVARIGSEASACAKPVKNRSYALRLSSTPHEKRSVRLSMSPPRACSDDENVHRLDVAVNDPLRVRRLERVGNLDRERQRVLEGQRPTRDRLLQRPSVEQLHHHELLASCSPTL